MEWSTMRTIDIREPVDIERLLVWTYRHQRADRVLGVGIGLFDQEAAMDGHRHCATSKDGVAAMRRIGALGTRVDGGGASAAALHIDAEIVHTAVMALPHDTSALVIVHARAASRPDDTAIPTPRAFPVKNERGRIVREYAEWDKSKNYGWTPLVWTAAPVTAAAIRRDYATWRDALGVLAFTLARGRGLTRHRPTPPQAAPSACVRHAARRCAGSGHPRASAHPVA
jgi:hypothetical protein